MNWGRVTVTFLLLRKNVKQLKQFIIGGAEPDQRREYLIGIKQELAKLSPEKYNLIKTIATENDRFIIKNLSKSNVSIENDYTVVYYSIPDTDIVLHEDIEYFRLIPNRYFIHNEDVTAKSMRGQEKSNIPWILYDSVHNIHFVIHDEKTEVIHLDEAIHDTRVERVDMFTESDHGWFIGIYKALEEMKKNEEEILRQQRILEEQMREERRKACILSKYA